MQIYDCVIVGGGPAGLTAALYLARFRRSVLLVDAGTSRALLAPASRNYPGFPGGISGADLLQTLKTQLITYEVAHRREHVTGITRHDGNFCVATTSGDVVARRLLFAAGIRDERPQVEGDHDDAVRAGVIRYCPICDGYESSDQRICVLGPLERALPKARFLHAFTPDVTIALTDAAELKPEIGKIPYRAFKGALLRPVADGILVPFADGGEERFDAVYPALGADPSAELATVLGARTDDAGCLEVDSRNCTSVEGLYAAGDIVSDLHQITVAVGHAAIAATAIHNSLYANERE